MGGKIILLDERRKQKKTKSSIRPIGTNDYILREFESAARGGKGVGIGRPEAYPNEAKIILEKLRREFAAMGIYV